MIMLTIDACVWVNGFDKQEANHKYSRQFLELVKIHAFPVFVPRLAGIVKTQTPEKALTELMIMSSTNQLSET
jgi:hypothetical protein